MKKALLKSLSLRLLTLIALFVCAFSGVRAEEKTSTLTFTAKCNGSGTANDGVVWTITSDASESTFDSTKGIHYGTGSSAVGYITLTASDIPGTIKKIVVNTSTANNVSNATVGVTVGAEAFGGNAQPITSTATDYTFEGGAQGSIVVTIKKPSKATKALYCKKIIVTYDETANPTCSAPTFTPAAGIYTSVQTVTITSATDGATIYYTTDGTDPTDAPYTDPITVSETTTIKAIAVKEGMDNSTVAEATYTIVDPSTPGTDTTPYTVAQARAAIDAGTGINNVYATGIVSEIPTAYSADYKNITFNIIDEEGSEFLQAFRCEGNDAANVEVGDIVVVFGNLTKYNSTYEFAKGCTLVSLTKAPVAMPTFSPAAGTYTEAQTVTINCATEGANVKYSFDGETWQDYTSAISLTDLGIYDIYAKATKGSEESAVAEAKFYIKDATKGTAENPYTVAEALAIPPEEGVYVRGIVSSYPSGGGINTNQGYATYNISDDAQSSSYITIYKGKYLENAAFVSGDQLSTGDEVVVYGNIIDYHGTNEVGEGNYLYSTTNTSEAIDVSFSFAASGDYWDASTRTFTITSPEQYTKPVLFIGNGANISGEIVFSSSNTSVATVDASTGDVTILGLGTAVITASFPGNASYKPYSTSYTIVYTNGTEVVIVEDDKTTFLFNTDGNEWGFPEGSANKTVEENTFTANGVSITLAGSEGNGYYYNTTNGHYLILGKGGAYLTLPAFDFAVGKIVVEGNSGASGSVIQNFYVGEEAVSTETTGAQATNSYIIASEYQAAGNVYTLKVLSKHNTQITKIIVYKATGEEKVNPQLKYSASTAEATLGQECTTPTLSFVEGFDGTITYSSDNVEVATVDAEGIVTLVAAGTAVITASFAGNTIYEAAEASYTITVNEAPIPSTDKFELVTDVTSLAANDVVILVGANTVDEVTTTYALGTNQKTNNREAVTVTVDADGTITPSSNVQQITLEDGWYFNVGDGYLYAASSSSNHLKTETEADDNAKATISIGEDGNATITFQGTYTRNTLRFNPNTTANPPTPLFSCYASDSSTGSLPQIYRKVTSVTPTRPGDVNRDGDVTIADVTALVNIILGKDTEGVYDHEAANVNGDEGITIADVTALVNIILGKN
ncbi:MAG: chitobiase/beta-hexosaminidase C-terminal domain-containing protein [Bacteroidaceae bacterium]|nr:chitobiase/beta-hexosaminidase C-terminal domain-containing protein [Bacteroidaceae bacterium]